VVAGGWIHNRRGFWKAGRFLLIGCKLTIAENGYRTKLSLIPYVHSRFPIAAYKSGTNAIITEAVPISTRSPRPTPVPFETLFMLNIYIDVNTLSNTYWLSVCSPSLTFITIPLFSRLSLTLSLPTHPANVC
jgi:hypothetical protein